VSSLFILTTNRLIRLTTKASNVGKFHSSPDIAIVLLHSLIQLTIAHDVWLFQVIGQDIYARFIDAASRLQAGKAVSYAMDGQTYRAEAATCDGFKNVVFKQVPSC